MNLKKIFSTLLAAVFIWTAVSPNLLYAQGVAPAPVNFQTANMPANDVAGLFKNFARVTSSEDFGGNTVVLNIQDFHMHPEVQRNIAAVIDVLETNYGIEKVFTEGAYGKVSLDWFFNIKDAELRSIIAEELLKDGIFTGSEYYAALNNKENFIYGIENEQVHQANIKRMAELIEKKDFYKKTLSQMNNDLIFLQKKYFNPANKKLSRLVKDHKSGKTASHKYYRTLLSYLQKNSEQSEGSYGTIMPLDLNDYPNILLFLRSDKLKRSLNNSKVSSDLQKIVLALRGELSYTQYQKLLYSTDNFKDTTALISHLNNLPEEFKTKYFTRDIKSFIEITSVFHVINPVELIKEERKLVENIRIALSLNKNELEVSFLSDFFLYFEDYMTTSIAADDHEYFENRFDKFKNMWVKYSFYNVLPQLEADFAVLSEYYSVNDKRNEIFISELSKHFDMKNKNASNSVLNKKAEDIISGKSNVIVCITGGYHSKGLSELLAGKNISYAVITPSISGDISAALQNYEALAVEQAKIFSQALALSLFSQVISYSVSNDNPGSYGFAAKLFTTAARTLEKMPHNDENVNRLIGNLNEAVGKDFKFSYDKNTGEVSFASADGKFSESFIKISQNAAGNMLINNTYSSSAQDKILLKSHGKILDKVQMSEFMDNFAKTFKTGTLNYGFDLFAPSVYYLSVSVVDWAVKNNIFLDISKVNGVSFRMAEIYALDKEILSKNPRVAKYPEQWQNAVMLQLIKKQDYSSSNWRQALFAANLLSEILPVSHDTLMMYESFPGNMVSVISEEANALRKGKRLEYDKSDLNDLIELGVVKARGNIGEIMSLTSVQILSQAHANLAKRENRPLNVTIISDTRYGGNEFVKAAAGVFLANGFNVMVFDSNMPTPFGSFQKDIVVNITASHNKGNDNGYKFTIDGAMVPRAYLNSLTEEITRIVDAEKAGNEEVLYVNPEGKYSIESSKDGAFEYAQSLLSMLAGFFNKTEKELLDIIEERQGKSPFFLFEANNGTAPALLGEVLDVFGIKSENVEVRHPGRDVGFGLMYDEDRGSPEPNERNLTNLRKYLEKLKGLIFAGSTDADADRIGTLMYSENGEIKVLTPNDTALIIAYAILKSKAEFSGKDAIVRSLPSGHILDYLAASFGVRTISVPVGAKHISKEFADKDNNVLLGMESSGTIFLNDWIRNKDGIMVNLLMYLIPVITGENYSGIFKEIYEKIGYTPYSAEDKLNLESKTKDSSLDFFKRATKKDIESLMDVSDESIFGKNARIETVKNDDGLYIGISNDETRRINSGFSSKNPKAGNLETGDIIWLLMRASGSENTMRIYSESYDKNMSGHLIEIGKRIAQGESANIDSSFMTTDETVKNYISKHPFIKWLYESSKRNKEGKSSVRRAIALSVISVSRSKLGAPVAELRNLSEALAAKLSGNESMLEAFVNSHNYENFGKAQLRNALEDIFKIIQAMNDDGASQDEIDKVIANMHRDYNKSLIIPSIKAALFSHLDIDKSQINDFDSDWYVKESFNPFDIDSTNIALIGPTNSGKTGMGNKISEDTGLPVLTIGTFLKAKAKQVQEIREKKKSNLTAEDRVNLKKYGAVEKKVNAGKLVPYRILVKIVFEELEKDVYKDGFIIDGFPSEMRSAHALNKFLIKRGKRLSVIELAADSQTIRDRQLASGGEINARFENKLKVYANSTAMVARYYKFLKYGERNNDYFDYVRFDEDELGLENLTEQIYPALIERINDIKGIFSSMKGDISVRNKFTPSVPKAFKNLLKVFGLKESDSKLAGGFSVEQAYPNTYGKPVVEIVKLFSKKKDGSFEMSREQENAAIVFYGGTASGGHNVIVGLFDMLKKFNSRSKIYGIMDGPRGFAKGTFMRLTPHFIELVKNTGGFGALRTGRGSKEDTFDSLVDNLQNRGITSLVVVGGDGTNTFAAKFSEHMKANNIDITVVSVPKTIDADFLNDELEATFGFDTFIKAAAVSLGSLVNNMISSAKQSWFVEVMGRETSNLTAELAVRTNANGAVLSEEVLEKNMTLKDVINYYTDIIVERSQNGINFGLYLLPEGLIPGIPEMEKLINQFDLIYEDYKKNDKNIDEIHAESIMSEVLDSLPEYEKGLALSLPPWFRSNLFFQRESDSGRLRYTKIETTKLIEDMVAVELRARKEAGKYNGNTELQKDSAGYGPNAAKASWFDATYSYTLGLISGVLIAFKKTGYMAYAKNLSGDVKKWIPKGIPVANMVGDTKRIKKSPVNLRGDFYAYYMEEMERNRLSREYAFILSKEYAFIDNPQLSGADGKKRNLTLSLLYPAASSLADRIVSAIKDFFVKTTKITEEQSGKISSKYMLVMAHPDAQKQQVCEKIAQKTGVPYINVQKLLEIEADYQEMMIQKGVNTEDEREYLEKYGSVLTWIKRSDSPKPSDDIIAELVSKRLSGQDCKDGFILYWYHGHGSVSLAKRLDGFLEKRNVSVSPVFFEIGREQMFEELKSQSAIDRAELSHKQYAAEIQPLLDYYGGSLAQFNLTTIEKDEQSKDPALSVAKSVAKRFKEIVKSNETSRSINWENAYKISEKVRFSSAELKKQTEYLKKLTDNEDEKVFIGKHEDLQLEFIRAFEALKKDFNIMKIEKIGGKSFEGIQIITDNPEVVIEMRSVGAGYAIEVYAESGSEALTKQIVDIGRRILTSVPLKNDKSKILTNPDDGYVLSYEIDGRPVLFNTTEPVGDSKNRGGSFLCYPYFGPAEEGMPQHGFGRNSKWQVESKSRDGKEISFALPDSEKQGEWKNVSAKNKVSLPSGNSFRQELTVKNNGKEAVEIAPAYHPFFNVAPGIEVITVYYGNNEKMVIPVDDLGSLNNATKYVDNITKVEIGYNVIEFTENTNLSKFEIWSNGLKDKNGNSFICIEPSYAGEIFVGEDRKNAMTLNPGQTANFSFGFTSYVDENLLVESLAWHAKKIKNKNFVILGAPASGKGTVADKVAEKLGIPHLSTGEMYREGFKKLARLEENITKERLDDILKNLHERLGNMTVIERKPDAEEIKRIQGQLWQELQLSEDEKFILHWESIKYVYDGGYFIPDEITNDMLFDELRNNWEKYKDGFILEGFPRTVEQAEAFDEFTEELGIEISLLSFEVSKESLNERRISRVNETLEKQAAGDKTAKIRIDDKSLFQILARLATHERLVVPTAEYYLEYGRLVVFNADDIEKTTGKFASKVISGTITDRVDEIFPMTETKEWKQLDEQHKEISKKTIKDLFASDPDRKNKEALRKAYIAKLKGKNTEMTIDTSFNNIDGKTMKLLLNLAKRRDVKGWIKKMMTGEKINEAEGRAVLHTALRNVTKDSQGNIVSLGPIYVDGKDVMPEIVEVLSKMQEFDKKLESGAMTGSTGKKIKTVVSIGIGGSDLGPKMAAAALEKYKREGIEVRFISNVDPRAAQLAMQDLDPETTMVIVESKTFTTQETMENANAVRKMMLDKLKGKASEADIISKHFIAVSTAKEKVSAFGIDAENNMFEFWDFVGGRFSLWSAIGMPLVCSIGFDNYFEMLQGANEMDKHFAEADYEDNIPIKLAMIWTWYSNFFKYDKHALIPYSEDLRMFPKYTQQLYMESLGKSTDKDGKKITDYTTGVEIYGEAGTDSQHSFFQLFHQGTGIVPIDFITYLEPPAIRADMSKEEREDIERRHAIFISNVLAQREAFAMGKNQEEVDEEINKVMANIRKEMEANNASAADIEKEMERYEKLRLQKSFDGNRPSNLITFDKQTPESLGMLISLYEHVVAVQSFVWNINAFDQWGVELGKKLAQKLQKSMITGEPMPEGFSASTNYWIDKFTGSILPKNVTYWISLVISNFAWSAKSIFSKTSGYLTESKQWKALQSHYEKIKNTTVKELFASDPDRKNKKALQKAYIAKLKGKDTELTIDTSFNNIDGKTMKLLLNLAKKRDVKGWIKKMMTGEKINEAEGRAVLHTALRNVTKDAQGNIISLGPVYVDGKDVMPEIVEVLSKMQEFDKKLESGAMTGSTGKKIKTVVSIGIGGSDLGPKMAAAALEKYKREGIEVRFISNVDPRAAQLAMADLDPETTMVIVESKTFTTQETMENANAVRKMMLDKLKGKASESDIISKHFIAVSTAKEKVSKFGIDAENNMFEFWDFVGGRFSLWSAIGMPLVCSIGFDNYFEMLQGANVMDRHFAEADYEDNIPIKLAMIWTWYSNFFKYDKHALIPYSEDLRMFPKYTQQLYMESLGKSTDKDGKKITDYTTGVEIYGEAGTDSQHSFFQLFHQGTGIVPIDFITYLEPPAIRADMSKEEREDIERRHAIFISNVLAQREAFAMGKNQAEVDEEIDKVIENIMKEMLEKNASQAEIDKEIERYEKLRLQKSFDGNRPSNLITFDKQTPESLGMLISLYEHVVAVQSFVWNINAFDQWGVELGKKLAQQIQPAMISDNAEVPDSMSVSTKEWVDTFRGTAIMKRNYNKVLFWLIGGESVNDVLKKVNIRELLPAIFTPKKFVNAHSEVSKAAARDFSIKARIVAFAFPIALIVWLPISALLLIPLTPLLGYFGFNVIKKIHIDMDYAAAGKAAKALEMLKADSRINLADKSDRYVNVLLINEMPADPEKYGFKNTGYITADGDYIWKGAKNGKLVVFSKSEDVSDVAANAGDSIKNMIIGSRQVEVSLMIVGDKWQDNLYFNDNGLILIKRSYHEEIVNMCNGDAKAAGEKIRKEREAEKETFAENNVMDLSTIEPADLEKALAGSNKAMFTNRQIALPFSYFENKTEKQIKDIVSEFAKSGTRIFAVFDDKTQNQKNVIDNVITKYDFAGYIKKDETQKAVLFRDFYSDRDSSIVDIAGFNTEKDLILKMKQSAPDAVRLVNVMDYVNIVNTAERDINSRIENLIDLFGTKTFTYFKNTITAESAVKTAMKFDMDIIRGDISDKDLAGIAEMYRFNKNGTKEALQFINNKALKLLSVDSIPEFKIFADRIKEKSVNPEETMRAFLLTIAKRAKVKKDIYSNGQKGLKDKELERLMVINALAKEGVDEERLNEFGREIAEMKADDAYKAIAKRASLNGENAADIYALLFKYAERQGRLELSRQTVNMDVRHVSNILSAA